MARVPYIDEHSNPELTPLIDTIRRERRGKLIPVYGLLLHSPDIAEQWMHFINAVRWKSSLSSRLREMVILRVALLNNAQYVIDVHMGHFAQGDGLSLAECEHLLDKVIKPGVFDHSEECAIRYVDELTLGSSVSDATHEANKKHRSDRELVELSVLIGAYNMHTRMINALKIDPEKA
jgi:alkylhydroperoxidase family enzyme